jgi:hypothetical protein
MADLLAASVPSRSKTISVFMMFAIAEQGGAKVVFGCRSSCR